MVLVELKWKCEVWGNFPAKFCQNLQVHLKWNDIYVCGSDVYSVEDLVWVNEQEFEVRSLRGALLRNCRIYYFVDQFVCVEWST